MADSIKLKMTIASVAALALLASCSGTSTSGPATSSTSPAPTMTQVTAPQPTTSPTSPGAPASANLPEAGFVAVATAEAEVPGSKAVELDLNDDGTWQVEVILGERKHEFEISADGTQIVEREESDADSDDVYRLVQVKVELIEAVRIAMARYAGEFDEIDLTSEDGVIVWEISLDDPDDVEVYVDVASGEIVESITDAVNR